MQWAPPTVRRGAALSLAVGLLLAPLTALADTRIVPSISVAERYDSNVYFFGAGANIEDYVTTVTPGVSIEHRGDVEGNVNLAMTGEYYMKNPGLNYFFPTASAYGNLDKLTKRVDQRWRLQVSESFQYTPRPPGFVAPVPAEGIAPVPATQTTASADFVRGIQAIRANAIMSTTNISSQYALAPDTNMVGSYTFQYMRFGTPFVAVPGAGFFTTSFHTLSAGPQKDFSEADQGTVTLQYQHIHFSQGPEFDSTFQTFGATLGWRHKFSKALLARANVGVVQFVPSAGLQYLGNLEMVWTQQNTTTVASYSRAVFPSFFIAAVPLVSNVLGVTVTHKLAENWTVGGGLNYANNESVSGPTLRFTSYGGTANVTYMFTRTVTMVGSYTYQNFAASYITTNYEFERNVVSLMLRKEWR